jgi:membrane protein implicated in regulation of membrane protease activity
MPMSAATTWWILTGLLVALELATGTFYLLMLALGCLAGALAAHAGLGLAGQMAAAALVGGGAVTMWYLRRRSLPAEPPIHENQNVHMDIGGSVHVDKWEPDGTAKVPYRGAQWSARWEGGGTPEPGPHVIRKLDGNTLVLGR